MTQLVFENKKVWGEAVDWNNHLLIIFFQNKKRKKNTGMTIKEK